MQFSKSLKKSHIFRRLYRKGRSAANGYLVLYCRKNGTGENRVGLTVSSKLGCAVVRNRCRRRLREVCRLRQGQVKRGYDLVVVARGRTYSAPFRQLLCQFERTCQSLGIWEEQQ